MPGERPDAFFRPFSAGYCRCAMSKGCNPVGILFALADKDGGVRIFQQFEPAVYDAALAKLPNPSAVSIRSSLPKCLGLEISALGTAGHHPHSYSYRSLSARFSAAAAERELPAAEGLQLHYGSDAGCFERWQSAFFSDIFFARYRVIIGEGMNQKTVRDGLVRFHCH